MEYRPGSSTNGSYESFYSGGYSSLNPEYGNYVGKRLNAGELAQSINPTTANQLNETAKALKTGLQEVEVQMLGPAIGNNADQQIPKEHFREMKQLLKLSGARASLHGPILEPTGTDRNGRYDELTRLETQRRFVDAMEKAYELNVDKKQAIPVVFHASNGMPGHLYVPDESKKPGEEGRMVLEKSYAINQETGEVTALKRETKIYPHAEIIKKGGYEQTPESQLRSLNTSQWDNQITELAQFDKYANEVLGSTPYDLKEYDDAVVVQTDKGLIFVDPKTNAATPVQDDGPLKQKYDRLLDADIFIENIENNFNSAFQKAYKYGSPQQQEELFNLAKNYDKNLLNAIDKNMGAPKVWAPILKKEALKKAITQLKEITDKGGAPKIFKYTEDFALEKSSDTFAQVALDSYKQFKKESPVIAIENYEPGTAFNRAEDLKKLIDETRGKFAKALQHEGMSKKEAQKFANEKIGATWDVGHVNLGKRYGYTDEDVVEETAKIASHLKHLHLTDNFGFTDSHLIPGMGNVPFKKHLEKLEREGVLDKVRKVVEAGGYIQQIAQRGVHGESAAAFGSPIYGAKMQNYWNQTAGLAGNYMGGYGMSNPSVHHSVYGAGFSNLPTELGGNIPGGGSRFSGNSFS